MSVHDRQYFMEIGLYRVPMDKFNHEYTIARERELAKCEVYPPDSRPAQREASDDLLANRFGWLWDFNQAIGWLRLYVRGDVVYAEYWLPWWFYDERRRFSRVMRDKRLVSIDKEALHYVKAEDRTNEISAGVRRGLVAFQGRLQQGRFVLDLRCFDALSPVLNPDYS